MWRRITLIAAIALALTLIALGSAVVWLANSDFNSYKNQIAEEISGAVGRGVRIHGDLKVRVSLIPSISAHSVTIDNPPWAQSQIMASVKMISAQIEILPLLFSEVRIGRIVLEDAEVALERGAGGQENWNFGPPTPADIDTPAADAPFAIDIKEIQVQRLKLTYRDVAKDRQDVVVIDSMSATSKDFGSEIEITTKGQVDGGSFLAEAKVGSLRRYSSQGTLPVQVNAKFLGADLDVGGTVRNRADDYEFTGQATIRGERARTTADEIRKIFPDIDLTHLPPVGPYSLAAKAHWLAGKLGLDALRAVIGKLPQFSLDIKGRIGDAVALSGIDLEISAEGANIDELRGWLAPFVTGLESVEISPLGRYRLGGHVTGTAAAPTISGLQFSVGQPDKIEVTAHGSVRDPVAGRGIAVSLSVRSGKAQQLFKAPGWSIPPLPAIEFDAAVADRPNGYHISDLKLKFDTSDVAGDISIEFPRKRPRIDARLSSSFVDVPTLLKTIARSDPKTRREAGGDSLVFPDEPLPLHFLDKAAVSLDWRAARAILYTELEVKNFRTTLTNDEKGLVLKPILADIAGGALNASVELSRKKPLPALDIAVNAKNLDLGLLLASLGHKDVLTGGKTRITAQLGGQGASIRALMAGLDGTMTTEVGEGRIHNGVINLYGKDIVSEVFTRINLFGDKSGDDRLQCAVVRAVSKAGQVQIPHGIALDTEKVSMVAGGVIDLKTEGLDIAFRTEPKKGLRLSIGQQIAGLLRLGGTLRSPSIAVDTKGAAEGALRWGGAVATGGISLLAERMYKETAKTQGVCQRALTEAPIPVAQDDVPRIIDQPVRSVVKGTGSVVEKGVEASKSIVKGTGEAIGTGAKKIGEGISRGLKSIFGQPEGD